MTVDLVSPIVVTLSPADVDAAEACAAKLVAYNALRGWRARAGPRDQARLRDQFTLGNLGELALAAWLDVPWTCRVGGYDRRGDVAGFGVRTSRHSRAPLLTLYGPRIDPDEEVFVLAVLLAYIDRGRAVVELAGWTTGRLGRLVGELRDFGGGPATYVRRDQLNPMGTLAR